MLLWDNGDPPEPERDGARAAVVFAVVMVAVTVLAQLWRTS